MSATTDDLASVLDTVWSEASEELRKALDVVSRAATSLIEHEIERLDRERFVATFKRDLLKAELEKRA